MNESLPHSPEKNKEKKRPNRAKQKNYDLVIDWFECTFLGVSEKGSDGKDHVVAPLKIQDVFKHFGLDPYSSDFTNLPSGLNGYNYTFVYKEKIKFMVRLHSLSDLSKGIFDVMNNYDYQMGVHMMLSGYACREFELKYSWADLFVYCIEVNANISRIDIAWDVFSKMYIQIDTIEKALRKSTITCRSKKALICDEIWIESGAITGQSIKFGSSASNIMLMVYDKLKERKNASYTVSGVDYWVRLELRIRKELALDFLTKVTSKVEIQKDKETAFYVTYNGDEVFTQLACEALFGFIKFREVGGNKQKTRWPLAPWWQKFIEVSEGLKLSNKAVQTSIQQKYMWIDLSVTKTVAQVLLACSDDIFGFQLHQFLLDGISKIEKMDLKQINTFRIEQGGSVLTDDDLNIIKEKIKGFKR